LAQVREICLAFVSPELCLEDWQQAAVMVEDETVTFSLRSLFQNSILFLVVSQLGMLIAVAVGADCEGAGLAKVPETAWYAVACIALFAMVCDALVGWRSGWAVVTIFFTGLNIVDVYTDAMAAGAVWAAHFCSESRLDSAWTQVVQQSAMPVYVPLWLLMSLAFCAGWVQLAIASIGLSQNGLAVSADLVGFETMADFLSEKNPSRDNSAESRTLGKFVFRLVAENLMQLHLQLSTVGLSLSLVGWDSAAESMLVSVGVSGFFVLAKLIQAAPVVCKGGPGAVVVLGIPTLGLVGYAAFKFWALFYCADHLVNVTGCVELEL